MSSSQAPYPSPLPFGHRLTHSAAPPLPTANAPLTLRREPYISPRDPLETTKGRGAAAPSLWNPAPGGWVKGRVRLRGDYSGALGRTVGGGICPVPGQGVLRGTGFRAGASLRTGTRVGVGWALNWNPGGYRAESCYTLCLSFRAARFDGAGGVGEEGHYFYPFELCHCEEYSDVAIRSFVGGLVCTGVFGRPHRATLTQC